jgi:hypothetical protein
MEETDIDLDAPLGTPLDGVTPVKLTPADLKKKKV